MADPFLGEIRLVGFNFAPQGWFLCNGQTLAISQYSALFALLGTTYGGNGVNTFQLPNLQGRVAMHQGNGPGLTPRVWGEQGGTENTTLLQNNMPQHNHVLNVSNNPSGAASSAGSNTYLNGQTESGESLVTTGAPNATLAPTTVGFAGGNVPFNNMQPFLVANYIIAYTGIFPSRN